MMHILQHVTSQNYGNKDRLRLSQIRGDMMYKYDVTSHMGC